jgi:uncharacterized protein (TIGR03000 family)
MYSIVMLTAMSAGADVTPPAMAAPVVYAPSVGCCGGIVMGGYSGCTGACYGSNWSSGYGSCYGSCHGSCSGSCSGSCHGGFLGLRSGGMFGRHSCHGSCHGSCSGYTCFGSCHGTAVWYGYGSCSGSCYGSVAMPPYSLHGYNTTSSYGPSAPIVVGGAGSMYSPNMPPAMTVPVAPQPKPAGSDGGPSGANLKFKLPADAQLFVDGKPAPGAGAERSFYTPPLEGGKKFYYDVEAKLVVNGKEVAETKKVIVEAGASVTAEFATLTAAAAAAARDSVAGK